MALQPEDVVDVAKANYDSYMAEFEQAIDEHIRLRYIGESFEMYSHGPVLQARQLDSIRALYNKWHVEYFPSPYGAKGVSGILRFTVPEVVTPEIVDANA